MLWVGSFMAMAAECSGFDARNAALVRRTQPPWMIPVRDEFAFSINVVNTSRIWQTCQLP
jgi:hypothetical protein